MGEKKEREIVGCVGRVGDPERVCVCVRERERERERESESERAREGRESVRRETTGGREGGRERVREAGRERERERLTRERRGAASSLRRTASMRS